GPAGAKQYFRGGKGLRRQRLRGRYGYKAFHSCFQRRRAAIARALDKLLRLLFLSFRMCVGDAVIHAGGKRRKRTSEFVICPFGGRSDLLDKNVPVGVSVSLQFTRDDQFGLAYVGE